MSVSLPNDVMSKLKERAGPRGVSAYVADAVRHKLAMEGLDDIIRDYEETCGPVDETLARQFARDAFGVEVD